jgi:hypothetical protein
MIIQECQHCVEFQWIEVMKMKLQIIQFLVVANQIQMKLMKMIHNLRNMMIREFQYHNQRQHVMMQDDELINDQDRFQSNGIQFDPKSC